MEVDETLALANETKQIIVVTLTDGSQDKVLLLNPNELLLGLNAEQYAAATAASPTLQAPTKPLTRYGTRNIVVH